MFRILGRVQVAYVGLFFAVLGFVAVYQAVYIWPIEQCTQRGGWWSAKYHECATPLPIWRFTGRLPATPQAAAAAAPQAIATAPK
jgi:hypothetical protein